MDILSTTYTRCRRLGGYMPTVCEREGDTGWGRGNIDKLGGVDTWSTSY